MKWPRLVPAVLIPAVLAGGILFILKGRIGMRDFEVNYTAGDRLAHGETLYRTTDEHYQFKYSPSSALLYLPLSLLPLPIAKVLWFVLILAAVVFSLAVSARFAGLSLRKAGGIVFLPGLVLAKYFFRELELGQINALIMAVFLSMAWCLVPGGKRPMRGREAAAGLLWGLATALKPYGVIFLPYFLLKKKWLSAAAGTAVLGLSLILPAVSYGFSGNLAIHKEWIQSLSRSTPGLLVSQDNISLLGFLSKWFGVSVAAAALFGLLTITLAVLTVFVLRKGSALACPEFLEIALLLLFIPLLSPLGWDYTFLSALPAVSLLVARFRIFSRPARILLGIDFGLIALTLYDLMGRSLYALFMAGSVLTICFLAAALALVYLRDKKFV